MGPISGPIMVGLGRSAIRQRARRVLSGLTPCGPIGPISAGLGVPKGGPRPSPLTNYRLL